MTRLASLLHCTDNAKPRIALTVDMGTIGCLSENSAAVRQFIQWVGEHHLNTTWVVDQARQLSWVATLQDRTTRHEVALNFNWATPELSRSQFQEELDKRWDACKQVAIQPTTAYSRDPESLRTRLSQLAPRGLTTWITELPQRTKSGRLYPSFSTCVPRPLPRGLWQLPTTLKIPHQRSWLSLKGAYRLPGAWRSQSTEVPMHALIVAEQVLSQGNTAQRQLDKFLQKVAWAYSADRLEVVTASQWTAAAATRLTSTPQRSILRTAA